MDSDVLIDVDPRGFGIWVAIMTFDILTEYSGAITRRDRVAI